MVPFRKNKYHNRPTCGYDSRKEKHRADQLRLMQSAGLIADLHEQVPFTLVPPQYITFPDGSRRCVERPVTYVADFVYTDLTTGSTIVEDVKGLRTDVYVIKRKLMLHVLGIRIKET